MAQRVTIITECDGGCGTVAEMDGSTSQPLIALIDAGWTTPVNRKHPDADPVQKHYCPVCSRARLVGTV